MNNSNWLSVIIPAYNCVNTIERLLDSILDQHDDDLEIIICDDHSTDNFIDKVKPYYDKLNIKYYKTKDREIHCPSNTRLDAWKHATGEWITFIDSDDMFEPDVFKEIKKLIIENNEKYLVFTNFRDYNYDTNNYNLTFTGGTWHHGKFYNRQWLIDEGIDFKENLYTNEDLYFNGLVIATLEAKEYNYTQSDICTYKWVYNPKSFTRSFDSSKHSLLETYFEDYSFAAIDPWINILHKYPNKKDTIFSHLCLMILYMYFYIQAYKFSLEDKYIKNNEDLIRKSIIKTCKNCNKNISDIINLIYSDPKFYDEIKHDAEIGSNKFIEDESFKAFINRILIL